eukprot:6200371-Pleurochrysis_carterae.AAC.3
MCSLGHRVGVTPVDAAIRPCVSPVQRRSAMLAGAAIPWSLGPCVRAAKPFVARAHAPLNEFGDCNGIEYT